MANNKTASDSSPASAAAPNAIPTPIGDPAAKSKKNKPNLVLIIVIILAIGSAALYFVFNRTLSTDNAMVERTKAVVAAKMLGVVNKINVEEGQTVDKDAILVEIDDKDLVAQRAQADENLAVSLGSYNQTGIALERAQDDFKRAQTQFDQKIISAEQYEHAQKAWESAKADGEVARKRIDAAKAQLAVADANLSNVRLKAPFDGVVAKKWIQVGEVLQPGQPILTLFERHQAWVTANFDETKLSGMRVNQPVTIRVDAYPGKSFPGHIVELGVNTGSQFSLIPQNNAAGNFTKVTQRVPVKIHFNGSTDLGDGSVDRMLPGMSAFIEIRQ